MQYTEEHYAEMYNNLPEGLKDLVLSGRLAILISAIGSRHGLNADQVADLEPAVEDVCLGLITKDELVDNILKNVQVDQRVANRIAAEAELEILKPFEAELIISRKQKEDLDVKIAKEGGGSVNTAKTATPGKANIPATPKDVSEHAAAAEKKVSDWYSKTDNSVQNSDTENAKNIPAGKVSFDWDKDFAKKETPKTETPTPQTSTVAPTTVAPSLETKLDVLTESINKLVNTRFGTGEKKEEVSTEMQELLKRLEKAEKENEENKKLIRSLKQGGTTGKPVDNIFGTNKIQIDKERKVGIDHTETEEEKKARLAAVSNAPVNPVTGNVQVTSVSKAVPIEKKTEPQIISSSVSKDTLDSIVETRSKPTPISNTVPVSTKKVLSLDELVSKGDDKIKAGLSKPTTLVFPGVNDEKRIDIKNVTQKDNLRQTLLDDLEFLKNRENKLEIKTPPEENPQNITDEGDTKSTASLSQTENPATNSGTAPTTATTSYTTNPFKDEILPKTKEERMKALQDKIKALNKGVSVGGKTNISASSLDPYRL